MPASVEPDRDLLWISRSLDWERRLTLLLIIPLITAIMIGASQILLGQADIVVAGGMESMTNTWVVEREILNIRQTHTEPR